MRDIFGLSVAIVMGLLTPLFRVHSYGWWFFLISAIVLFLISGGDLLWRNRGNLRNIPAPKRRVRLTDAARRLYEALERAGLEDAEGYAGQSPANVFQHAQDILLAAAQKGRIRLFGQRLPSSKIREIPADMISGLKLSDTYGNVLVAISAAQPVEFRNVEIRRLDVRRAIKERISLLRRINENL